MALQTLLSRNVHPLDQAVVTVGAFNAGSASNVIPDRAELILGVRSFDPAVRDLLERRIGEIVHGQVASYGMTARVDYTRSYDATINHARETDLLRGLATRFAGADNVVEMPRPTMGSEDFAYMLKARPGSYFFPRVRHHGQEPAASPPRLRLQRRPSADRGRVLGGARRGLPPGRIIQHRGTRSRWLPVPPGHDAAVVPKQSRSAAEPRLFGEGGHASPVRESSSSGIRIIAPSALVRDDSD